MAFQKAHQKELDVEAVINEFEQKLDRLKILYEQYFIGVEKREPLVPLKDVVRVMRQLEQVQIRNTGHRYRYRNLVQKFNVYRTYWNRTLREKELGTYHRDVARMSRGLARRGISVAQLGKGASVAAVERALTEAVHDRFDDSRETGQHEAIRKRRTVEDDTGKLPAVDDTPEHAEVDDTRETGKHAAITDEVLQRLTTSPHQTGLQPEAALGPADLNEEDEDTGRSASVGPPRPARTPRKVATLRPAAPQAAPPAMPQGISEGEMQSLYRRFVKAKEMCGEDTKSIRYESLVKSIASQLPKIQAEHQGRAVEFQVVIRGGRAILRAKPR